MLSLMVNILRMDFGGINMEIFYITEISLAKFDLRGLGRSG